MELLDFMDKHASAIFGVIGTAVGFMGNAILQKWNQKFEVTKDIAKEYYKDKKIVLTKALQLISDYETSMETLHDFIDDEHGVPVKILKKEDVFAKYFKLIFEYLHVHRLYLNSETIKKLDLLKNNYHNYILESKFITSEMDNEDMSMSFDKLNEKLYQDARINFHKLIEEIKYDEIKNLKEKLEQA